MVVSLGCGNCSVFLFICLARNRAFISCNCVAMHQITEYKEDVFYIPNFTKKGMSSVCSVSVFVNCTHKCIDIHARLVNNQNRFFRFPPIFCYRSAFLCDWKKLTRT